MNVSIVPVEQGHEDFQEFTHAVEVRSSNVHLVQQWTYRSLEHAEREKKRISEWFKPPVERGGRVIPC